MNKLGSQLNNHKFPSIVFKFPVLIKIVHFLENLINLKHWHIHSVLKKHFKEIHESVCCMDIGCGSGVFSLPYSLQNNEIQFTCYDINQNNLDLIQKYKSHYSLNNIKIEKVDIAKHNLLKTYDLILCISALEYINDDKRLLKEIKKCMNDNSHFLLYLPIMSKRILPFYEFLNIKVFTDVSYDKSNSCKHFYTKESIIEKLDECGFQIIKCKSTYGLFGKLQYEIYELFLLVLSKIPMVFAPILVILLILLLPILLLFMLIDFIFPHKEGSGIMILAK